MPKANEKPETAPIQDDDDDVSAESSDSSSDDDSLVLEGQLVRNPDVSSSSSDEDDDDDVEEEEVAAEEKPAKSTANKKTDATDNKRKQHPTTANSAEKNQASKQKKKKKKQRDDDGGVDMSYVEFIFCDMHEKYWDGLKALISNAGSALYQAHSSALADQMIEYDMVGTVLAQDHDPEHNVYGFGSILHWGHFPTAARQQFASVCGGPPEVGSTKSSSSSANNVACQKRVAQALQADPNSPNTAFMLMGRMINVPVEIVYALHQQVWQDVVWAQKEKTKLSYKKIDTVLRLAPCTQDGGDNSYVYRYFEDELLAAQAVGSYVVEAPRSFSREDTVYLQVLELTLPAYERAIQALERMVNGSNNNRNTKK
eukprot:scaffold898_cov168-Amphora_coffeaeformis.AAC.13